MQTIAILADERPGLLTDISYILSKENIRVQNIGIEAVGGKTAIVLAVRDGAKTKEALAKNGFEVIDRDAIVLHLPDYVKKIDYIKNKLSESRIRLKQFKVLGCDENNSLAAILVDKPRKAFKLLSEFVVSVD